MTQDPYPAPVPVLSGTVIPSQATFIAFASTCEQWLDWLTAVKRSAPRTVQTYRSTLNRYVAWFEQHGFEHGAGNPNNPELAQLEAFLHRPRHRQGKGSHGAPATVSSEIAALKGVFGWAKARGMVPRDPTLDLVRPKVPRKKSNAIPYDHWVVFHNYLADQGAGRYRLFVATGLGYVCGLRASEVWRLTGDQLHGRELRYVKRKGHVQGETATVPWRSMLDVYEAKMPELFPRSAEWAEVTQWLFSRWRGKRIFQGEPQNFHRAMYKVWDLLDLPRYRAHDLRDSCATNLVNSAGVPLHIVQELMNHSDINTTMGYIQSQGKVDDWLRGA